jgi:mannan endo-1,4-beta-mannosidase
MRTTNRLMHGPRSLVRVAAALVALATLSASTASAEPESGSAPPPGSVLWGAYVPGAPFDASLLNAFEASTGKNMSIVHWGEPWVMNGAAQQFQGKQFQAVRNRGAIPMLTWGSWELGKDVNQPAFRLANVAGGKYDAYIRQWAQAAKAWGQPFFLRFDHEMNGWWQFPWAVQANGNRPGDYVAAWRHVHDIFVQQGVTNATWVWCPNISGRQTTPLASVYPGDSYVDWTCMDGYNWGATNGNVWQSFNQVFAGGTYTGDHNTYAELLALAPNKPIMIGETASSEVGGSKAAWISDMLLQVPRSFPAVRAVVWMNWNASDPAISWPLASSADAGTAFATGIAAPEYAANWFAAQTTLLPSGLLALPRPSASPPVVPATDPAVTTATSADPSSNPASPPPDQFVDAAAPAD